MYVVSINRSREHEMETNMRAGTLDLHNRIKAATEAALADATAKGQKARIRFLTGRLAEINAVQPTLAR